MIQMKLQDHHDLAYTVKRVLRKIVVFCLLELQIKPVISSVDGRLLPLQCNTATISSLSVTQTKVHDYRHVIVHNT